MTVRFSAGGEDGDPDPTDDYDGDDLGKIDLTINVTNKNEAGQCRHLAEAATGRHHADGNPHRRGQYSSGRGRVAVGPLRIP